MLITDKTLEETLEVCFQLRATHSLTLCYLTCIDIHLNMGTPSGLGGSYIIVKNLSHSLKRVIIALSY